ncbi:DNA cytosine methyltransferase [Pseudomonas aeruginosa]
MTTIINTKIGESKNVARLWLEGRKLERAGVRIGARYQLVTNKAMERLELREAPASANDQVFTVSKRERRGNVVPLMEIRSKQLTDLFENIERVRVAIKNGRIVVTALHLETKVRERVKRLTEKLRSSEPLAVASLFMGGGVLDKALHSGLRRAGVKTFVQVGVELEPDYLDSSLENNPEIWNERSVAICSDIREVNWGGNVPQCDILVGGVPCTGASKAGRSKNKLGMAEEHSSAGALFVDYLDAVKALNPAVCIVENVPEYQSTAAMVVIRSVLASLGYQLKEAVLNGNDFGALERRNRLVLVATSKGLPDLFDFDQLAPVREKEGSISEVLEDIPLDSERWKPFDYLAAKEARDKAAGKGFARQLLTGTEGHCGTIGRAYAKCRSTEPFLVHPVDPSLSRLFTPVEHARLKGIPEEIISGLPDTTAHEVLGQSVIYPMFVSVGIELGVALTGAVNPDVAACRSAGITSFCDQVCGGGNCGSGEVCYEGINPETRLPGLPEADHENVQFQLSLQAA